jgi:hypothetical protein
MVSSSGSCQMSARTSTPRAAAASSTSKTVPRPSGSGASRSTNASVTHTRVRAASTAATMRRNAGSPSIRGRTAIPVPPGVAPRGRRNSQPPSATIFTAPPHDLEGREEDLLAHLDVLLPARREHVDEELDLEHLRVDADERGAHGRASTFGTFATCSRSCASTSRTCDALVPGASTSVARTRDAIAEAQVLERQGRELRIRDRHQRAAHGADAGRAEADVLDRPDGVAEAADVAQTHGLVRDEADAAEEVLDRLLGREGDGQPADAEAGEETRHVEAEVLERGDERDDDDEHLDRPAPEVRRVDGACRGGCDRGGARSAARTRRGCGGRAR